VYLAKCDFFKYMKLIIFNLIRIYSILTYQYTSCLCFLLITLMFRQVEFELSFRFFWIHIPLKSFIFRIISPNHRICELTPQITGGLRNVSLPSPSVWFSMVNGEIPLITLTLPLFLLSSLISRQALVLPLLSESKNGQHERKHQSVAKIWVKH